MALLIGAALGVSGAIFQSLTRNPLGSPDVMGFNTGAWSGVLMALLIGAALGVSGAIFQSLTRNPLGSPDVMGF
ncbi:hypothetical protein CQA61_30160, partial [Klebsiella pneumoniae]